MRVKLLKKWRKFMNNNMMLTSKTTEPGIYASVVGDLFFIKHFQRSRLATEMKVAADLHGLPIDSSIVLNSNALHVFCPSRRLKKLGQKSMDWLGISALKWFGLK